MSEVDKLNKIMIDVATLIAQMDMVTAHIQSSSSTPTRICLLEDSMNSVKKIMWGLGSIVATSLIVAVLGLIII